jgi:chromosome segregation ATPase
MKNFQQTLFLILAFCLCALCACQWYVQTLQRAEVVHLGHQVYEKSMMIRDCTNSIAVLNHQISEMDSRLSELKEKTKTNEMLVVSQKREISKLETNTEGLTNAITEYREAIGNLEGKLKDAYDGIRKQNDSLKELVAQRDEFVNKYNDSVKEQNHLVAKYNNLVEQVKKAQSGGE